MTLSLRPYQRSAIEALYEYFSASAGNPLVVLPTGCHAAGTLILMHDGSTKSVEDVVPGDLLMGPDSKPRRVLQLARGHERMWQVTPKRGGDAFAVNEGLNVESLANTGVVTPSMSESLQRAAERAMNRRMAKQGAGVTVPRTQPLGA